MDGPQGKLAAIVQADVAGYSRLIGVDEDGTLSRLRAHRAEAIDPKISEYDGRIVETEDDCLLLEFHTAFDAVDFALDIQSDMAARNAGLTIDERLEFRIGIHLGDVLADGDDVHGDDVEIAAGIKTLADPGGICLSRDVRDKVLNQIGAPLEDQGDVRVETIAQPIQVFKVVLLGPAPQIGLARFPNYHRYVFGALIAAVIVFNSYGTWFGKDLGNLTPAALEGMAHGIISETDQGHYNIQGATKINAKEAKTLLDQGVAVFEMRNARYWRAGHPANARFWQTAIGEFNAANLEKVVKKDQAVAFYCGGFT